MAKSKQLVNKLLLVYDLPQALVSKSITYFGYPLAEGLAPVRYAGGQPRLAGQRRGPRGKQASQHGISGAG